MSREELLELGFKNNEGSRYFELYKETPMKDKRGNFYKFLRVGIHLFDEDNGRLTIQKGHLEKLFSDRKPQNDKNVLERVVFNFKNESELLFFFRHFGIGSF